MDSLTHIVFGACIGEAVAGRYMNKRAMFYGAVAQSVPDADFAFGFFLHGADNVAAHRGLTHSILFGLAAVFFLTWLVKDVIHKTVLPYRAVFLLFAVNIFTHLFIDSLNAYGVMLLYPFSRYRSTANVLFVADPLFSVGPAVSFLFLLFLNKSHARRRMWVRTGIAVSALYLCVAVVNKTIVGAAVTKALAARQQPADFFTTPSPFNSLLWFVAVKEKDGYSTAYRSVFDKGPVGFTYFPKNERLCDGAVNQKDVRTLKEFAQGWYTAEQWHDTTVMNVLRFGQVVGWYDPQGHFAFHYYVSLPNENDLVVQRGRFERWTKESTKAFFRRMFGGDVKRGTSNGAPKDGR